MAERAPIQHLVSLQDLSDREIEDLLDLSLRIKKRASAFRLEGKSVGLLFFRGSLRTRTSFEAAMHQLGGHGINLNASSDFWELESQEGARMDGKAPEHVKDAALVLSRYVNALAIRPALQGQSWATDRRDTVIRSWAAHARVPVINMESALWHPLQALADLMTMRERLGASWCIAEGGMAGPTSGRSGAAPGRTTLAIVGPVRRTEVMETGHADREENMSEFTTLTLRFLRDAILSASAS